MSQAVDLVTGWMLGALITPAEYRREYQVVQRELEKDKGEPDWVFYDLIADQPLPRQPSPRAGDWVSGSYSGFVPR